MTIRNKILPLFKSDLDHVLSLVGDNFRALSNQSTLITGASGFIGSWMLETAIYAAQEFGFPVEISIITRNKNAFLSGFPHLNKFKGLNVIETDVRNYQSKNKFEYIVHAAAIYPSPGDSLSDKEIVEIQTTGTKNVLSATNAHSRFLYLSSGAVYDRAQARSPIKENSPLLSTNKSTAYAKGKIEAEREVLSTQDQLSNAIFSIARCFSFIGPRMDIVRPYAASDFIHAAMTKQQISMRTDGQAVRSYMYAADLAVWLWNILFRGHAGEIYNVGSSDEITIANLAKEITCEISPGADVTATKEVITEGDYYVPDVSYAQSELELSQTFTLREAIKKTSQYYATGGL